MFCNNNSIFSINNPREEGGGEGGLRGRDVEETDAAEEAQGQRLRGGAPRGDLGAKGREQEVQEGEAEVEHSIDEKCPTCGIGRYVLWRNFRAPW